MRQYSCTQSEILLTIIMMSDALTGFEGYIVDAGVVIQGATADGATPLHQIIAWTAFAVK